MINHIGNYTLHRWSDGTRSLRLRVEPTPGPFGCPAPELRGWECHFHGVVGVGPGSHTTYSYRRAGAR